jgi:hypothetical protein
MPFLPYRWHRLGVASRLAFAGHGLGCCNDSFDGTVGRRDGLNLEPCTWYGEILRYNLNPPSGSNSSHAWNDYPATHVGWIALEDWVSLETRDNRCVRTSILAIVGDADQEAGPLRALRVVKLSLGSLNHRSPAAGKPISSFSLRDQGVNQLANHRDT